MNWGYCENVKKSRGGGRGYGFEPRIGVLLRKCKKKCGVRWRLGVRSGWGVGVDVNQEFKLF